jgi:integrase
VTERDARSRLTESLMPRGEIPKSHSGPLCGGSSGALPRPRGALALSALGVETCKLDPFAIAAIRLLLLTGCRSGEILNLRWSEVDLEPGLLHLPDSKTGKKSILLAAPAMEVLASLPRAGEFVVPGGAQGRRANLRGTWARVSSHAELHRVRLHDLRHSFASVGACAGLGLPIIGRLLGHAQPSTTARYSHLLTIRFDGPAT